MSKTVRTALAVLVVAALVVVAGVVWWTQRDDRPRVAVGVGTEPPDTSARIAGLTSDLQLPFADYLVTVGEPLEELPPPCCVAELADVRAPEGGSFVGVAVELSPSSMRDLVLSKPGTEVAAPTFTLVVDGGYRDTEPADYPVTMIDDDWDATTLLNRPLQSYVAVDGMPDLASLSLRVDYDGVSQVVQPSRGTVVVGDAAQLRYSDQTPREVTCGPVRPPAGFVQRGPALCDSTRERQAYVGGVGWAPPGRVWLVVRADTPAMFSLERVVGDQRHVYLTGTGGEAQVGITLAGQQPVTTWEDNDDLVAVFAQPERTTSSELVVTATYGDLDDRNDPRPVDEVTLTWRSTF